MNSYMVRTNVPEKVAKELSGFNDLTQTLLHARGIETTPNADIFLKPNYETGINDPFLMLNMDKAVKRVLEAIKNKEHIVIYSDYDCDGIPGGVVLHDFFKKIEYKNFSNYIPHRHEEGYGLNISAIESVAKDDAKLLITVDCGITDRKPVDRANELGIDVIITDHHLQNGDLPKAFTVLNPNQDADNSYPFKGLCGAGVAFKLVQGLLAKGKFNVVEGWDKWLLDMAGLSTVADMVPLTDENRVIAHFGLHVLRKSPRPGVQQLCKKIKVNQQHITEDDIGFMIGPRINAASRMDHPMEAFKLLSTDSVEEGGKLSEALDKLNSERKGIVAAITKKASKMVKDREQGDVIVVGNPDWKPALLGLIANALVEEFKKPLFVWGRDENDILKGSCRSDGSVNLVDFMASVDDVFIDAGGHKFAGGFSIKEEHIHSFEKVLNEAYKKLPKDKVTSEIIVEKILTVDDVNWDTFRDVDQFAPFGVGNDKPLFLFKNIQIHEVKHFGKDKNHLQITYINSKGKPISSMGFFQTENDHDREIMTGEHINLVATFEKSVFRGFPELRLRIVDIY